MTSHKRPLQAAALALLIVTGCQSDHPRSVEGSSQLTLAVAEPASFHDHYVRTATFAPEQSETDPIVRLSGADRSEDGRMLISDVSERNVKLFANSGELLTRIGRGGEGPGEFVSPRFPRFGPDGRIHVADAQINRIQVFDDSGALKQVINLNGITRIMGFAVLEQHYLILSTEGGEPEVLFLFSREGERIAKGLPIAHIRPEGQPDHPAWNSLRSFSLQVRNDTAFVSSSLSDTLWQVDMRTGVDEPRSVKRTVLEFPGYVKPELPSDPPRDIHGLIRWTESVHTASTLSVGGTRLYLPYVQGVLNYGDPMILVAQDGNGGWRSLHDAPPVVFSYDDVVVAIEDPDADYLTLGLYAPRK